jgi:pyruvate dehydrogenase E1 component alpha subunit
MAEGLGIAASTGNGNDVAQVFEMAMDALSAIRAGGGPRFLEFSTYRWLEHCGPNYDNDIGYRNEEEFLEWKKKDPIANYEAKLIAQGILTSEDLQRMDTEIQSEVFEAFDFADASPFPEPESAGFDLYAMEPAIATAQQSLSI